MTERIGPYRLIEEIGRGGMGIVYLAERDGEFTQRIAVKHLHGFAGDEALRRFGAERRMLASLDHPGIARLIDGGAGDGAPYLVIEFVDGPPIDRYCDQRHLTVRQRLELFVRVCDAVSYAHRRLIVHRDLKPSNILVTSDGTPKLLDFGIAAPVQVEHDGSGTADTTALLTPDYASPEQMRGEAITTAADVYALGVLLFELLAGRRPYALTGRSPADVDRIVCVEEPPAPSAAAGAQPRAVELRGDLDTIVLKALRKAPPERYASVDQFAGDVRRFLDGRPVLARAATWSYVARRFVGRHRGGVAAAALFAIMLAAFGAALGWSAARARHERDAAERVTSMLVQLFSGSDPRSPRGASITAEELLDRGAEGIRRDLGDQADVQARLLDAVGAIYSGLGLVERARSVLHAAPSAWSGTGIVDSPPAAFAMRKLAESLQMRGQLAAAEPVARESVEMTRRLFGPRNPQVGEALNTLGLIVYGRGRFDEAERIFLDMTDLFRDSLGPEHPMVGTGLHNTALVHRARGDEAGGERLLREAIVIRRGIIGQVALDNFALLADIVRREGRADEAERMLRQTAEAMRWAHHARIDLVLIPLADLLRDGGRPVEAATLYAEARDIAAARLGPAPTSP